MKETSVSVAIEKKCHKGGRSRKKQAFIADTHTNTNVDIPHCLNSINCLHSNSKTFS